MCWVVLGLMVMIVLSDVLYVLIWERYSLINFVLDIFLVVSIVSWVVVGS